MTDHAHEVDDHIQALRQAREAIDRALALLAADGGAVSDEARPQWVNLATAAHHCGRHPDSMARLVRANGLGRRIGRDWQIDMVRVRAWQEGCHFPPLPTGPSDIVGHRGESSDVPAHVRSQNVDIKER
jgi:hypothetical protein